MLLESLRAGHVPLATATTALNFNINTPTLPCNNPVIPPYTITQTTPSIHQFANKI
jgi:hypothetical protein